jgi:hypothetical protein
VIRAERIAEQHGIGENRYTNGEEGRKSGMEDVRAVFFMDLESVYCTSHIHTV